MPCPHFKITICKRSNGQSAVAGAAYQSGESLFSEYDQKRKAYTEKRGIAYTEIMLPVNAPPEYRNREKLWNAVEMKEKQWNSQLARRIVLALPKEIQLSEQIKLLQEYCKEQFVDKGMCVDFLLHQVISWSAPVNLTLVPTVVSALDLNPAILRSSSLTSFACSIMILALSLAEPVDSTSRICST